MKHFYEKCPYNPDRLAVWPSKETNCPWCLQERILWFEDWYRNNPESAVNQLNKNLGFKA